MALEDVGIPVYTFAPEQFVGTQEEAVVEKAVELWEEYKAVWGEWYFGYTILYGIYLHIRLHAHLMRVVEQIEKLGRVLNETNRRRLAWVLEEMSPYASNRTSQRNFKTGAQHLLHPEYTN